MIFTNGYTVENFNPYLAIINDAEILRYILQTLTRVKELLRTGDVFVINRGFRDVVELLE